LLRSFETLGAKCAELLRMTPEFVARPNFSPAFAGVATEAV
jgi:hypothetical protein